MACWQDKTWRAARYDPSTFVLLTAVNQSRPEKRPVTEQEDESACSIPDVAMYVDVKVSKDFKVAVFKKAEVKSLSEFLALIEGKKISDESRSIQVHRYSTIFRIRSGRRHRLSMPHPHGAQPGCRGIILRGISLRFCCENAFKSSYIYPGMSILSF